MKTVMTYYTDRHATDVRRQLELAGARVTWHRERVEQGRRYRREGDEGRPEQGDTLAWMEAYVREMVKKHREEREIIISVLQVRASPRTSVRSYVDAYYLAVGNKLHKKCTEMHLHVRVHFSRISMRNTNSLFNCT